MEDVSTATELVGTALGNGIHATTNEVGLTNVIGRNYHLQLLDSLDTDGVTTTRKFIAQTEVIVEVGTINGEVGGTAVGTGKAHTITAVRRQTGNVGQAAGYRGQVGDLGAVDVGGSTGFLSPELGGSGSNNYLAEGVSINTQIKVKIGGLGQLQGHAFNAAGLVADVGHANGVRATGTHTLDGVTALHVGHGVVLGARGRVQSSDCSTNHSLLVLIGHNTGQCRSRHLSTRRQCYQEHCHQSQKLNCSQHKSK